MDIHDQVACNPDYVVALDDVRAGERRHGPGHEGAFGALRADWSEHWPDHAAMQNNDARGVAHYSGWSQKALK